MRQLLFLIVALLLAIPTFSQSADDAAFRKQMEDYARRLKAAKTPQEGQKILGEMRAKQQAYLAKKTDTVMQLKNHYGADQIKVGANQIGYSTGGI